MTFTIVTPVYNRTAELRRALDSLVAQTCEDFECVVVDDASTIPVAPLVAEYDERFSCVRGERNVGPNAARFLGFERMRGDALVMLDSDNELFPWALERARYHLQANPEVGGVTGLYEYPDGVQPRAGGGTRVVTPEDYRHGEDYSRPFSRDGVGVVRRATVQEWLQTRRRDYYSLEFTYWLSHRLRHLQLVVDEPWGRYNVDAGNRVTLERDPRCFRDLVIFVEDFRPEIGTDPCVPVDQFLRAAWLTAVRAGRRSEAKVVKDWMRERGSTVARAVAERMVSMARERLAPASSPSPTAEGSSPEAPWRLSTNGFAPNGTSPSSPPVGQGSERE